MHTEMVIIESMQDQKISNSGYPYVAQA